MDGGMIDGEALAFVTCPVWFILYLILHWVCGWKHAISRSFSHFLWVGGSYCAMALGLNELNQTPPDALKLLYALLGFLLWATMFLGGTLYLTWHIWKFGIPPDDEPDSKDV